MRQLNITKVVIILFLMLKGINTFAQVGINTENPMPGGIHIDAKSNNNSVGTPTVSQAEDDVYLDSDGNLGIGTVIQTSRLEIRNRDADKTGSVIKIQNGQEADTKVLVSDNQGIASWDFSGQTVIQTGLLGDGYTGAIATTGSAWIYTNASITLPPGDWVVMFSILLDISKTGGTIDDNSRLWVRTTLSDAANASGASSDIVTGTGGTNLVSDLAYVNSKNVMNGVLRIDNTSDGDKTYYYKIENSRAVSGTATGWSFNNFASKNQPENSIFAFKVTKN